MAKISVLMGVYKITDEKILRKSINSILNQTYTDFEFIICDDGSNDGTIDLVKKICERDSRVKIIQNNTNKGLAYVLNKCFEHSSGEYIARMDADDESKLDRFEKQINFLEKHKDIDLVACCCNLFDENGIYGERVYNEYIEKKDFLYNSPIVHPTIMLRRKSFERINGYRDIPKTYRVEDYDLFMRMIIDGQKIYTIQEKLFNFREDEKSYARRKYKYRINEFKVRYENFKKMGLLPKYIIYVVKPLIVGLIPGKVLKKIKEKDKKYEN